MIEIGITGNIGSGKSAVSSYLLEKGYQVVDADEIVKQIYTDKEYIRQMIDTFGEEITVPESLEPELDKRKIFDIVFNDKEKLATLDKMVGPFFKAILNRELKRLEKESIVFFDIPLLYEKNYQRFMDKVILVSCDDNIRYERASKRDNKEIEEIRIVDKSQMPQEEKKKLADFVLDNNSTLENLYRQIEETLKQIEDLVQNE
ncbi:MAG: dephospho-CoA kinase [Peptostreptococcaceae bacterium]|nr:dephospho-CoA kinase [Peptostreptococcaceae bacterium]